MRSNIVFRNIAERQGENVEDIKCCIASIISDETGWDFPSTKNIIIRAHRSGKVAANKPRAIYVKFSRDDIADDILKKLRFNKKNIHVDKQYTPDLQTRRNKALAVRKELKAGNFITKGYVEYPAKLYVMTPDSKNLYIKHSEY